MNNAAVFLESYYLAISQRPKEEIADIFCAICKLALYGEESELEGVPGQFYLLMRPSVLETNRRYEAAVMNGKKGGRPKKVQQEEEDTGDKNLKDSEEKNLRGFEDNNLEKEKEREKETEKETEMEMETEKQQSLENINISKSSITQKKSKKKSPPDIFFSFACGDEILLKALRDFEEMRRLKKKPMTDRAKEMLCNKLKTFPPEEREATLLQSIEHGWDTVYSLHEEAGKGTDNPFLKMLEEF